MARIWQSERQHGLLSRRTPNATAESLPSSSDKDQSSDHEDGSEYTENDSGDGSNDSENDQSDEEDVNAVSGFGAVDSLVDYFNVACAKNFEPLVEVTAGYGLTTTSFTDGMTLLLQQGTRVTISPRIHGTNNIQLGVPGGQFFGCASIADVASNAAPTAEGRRYMASPAGTQDCSGDTFRYGLRMIATKSIKARAISSQMITIPAGAHIHYGSTPYIPQTTAEILRIHMGGQAHHIPLYYGHIGPMIYPDAVLVPVGAGHTVSINAATQDYSTHEEHHGTFHTVANDYVACGEACQKVQVRRNEQIEHICRNAAGLHFCRKVSSGETFVMHSLSRNVQNAVSAAEAINDMERPHFRSDMDQAAKLMLVENNHPLLLDEHECARCGHFFHYHEENCINLAEAD